MSVDSAYWKWDELMAFLAEHGLIIAMHLGEGGGATITEKGRELMGVLRIFDALDKAAA